MDTVSHDCVPPETLKAYACNALDESERQRVEQHLENCQHCCIQLSTVVDTDRANPAAPLESTLEAASWSSDAPNASILRSNPAYRYWVELADSKLDNNLPSTIGRYRIEKLIGAGGFGRVYQAIDEQLGRKVAIKVSLPSIDSSEKQLALIQDEAKIVASLDHPNIVPIYDFGSSTEFPVYLVSKLINGRNLALQLQQGVEKQQVVGWTIQIADALAYAHDQGVIHRDVKPQNIIIDSSGDAKLTDFGLAWRSSNRPSEYPTAGTPAYMSPEQQRADQSIDFRTDIYSLGRVLSELVDVSCKSNSAQDGELVEICRKATTQAPTDRYASASEFAQSLRGYAMNQGWSGIPQALNTVKAARLDPKRILRLCFNRRTVGVACLLLALAVPSAAIWHQKNLAQAAVDKVDQYLASPADEIDSRLQHLNSLDKQAQRRLSNALESSDSEVRLRAQLALLGQKPELLDEVTESMLSARVDLAMAIALRLLPYKESIGPKLIEVMQDKSRPSHACLNAAGYLVAAYPTDDLWKKNDVVGALLRALQNDGLKDMQSHARVLRPVKTGLVARLRTEAIRTLNRSDPSLIKVFEIWEELVEGDDAATAAMLVECPAEIVDRLLMKLRGNENVTALLHALLDLAPFDPNDDLAGPLYRAKATAAYALFRLGYEKEFWQLWEYSAQPDLKTVATKMAGESIVTLGLIANRLLDEQMLEPLPNAPLGLSERLHTEYYQRAQLVHTLFRTPGWQGLDENQRDLLFAKLRKLVLEEPDAAMQAQAYWLVKACTHVDQWPAEPWFPRDQLPHVDPNRNWSLNSLGMLLIHVEDRSRVPYAFAMSNYEVQRKYFDRFLSETQHLYPVAEPFREGVERRGDFPQSHVSWYDCACFSNWLSRREGLQECYELDPTDENAIVMRLKPDYAQLNGYRLPTSLEWQICCRAGAETQYYNGDLKHLVKEYAWMKGSCTSVTPSGHLPPNALGFLDMHGNLSEWMLEPHGDAPDRQQQFMTRGGCFRSEVEEVACDRYTLHAPTERSETIGFRIVRSCDKASSQ